MRYSILTLLTSLCVSAPVCAAPDAFRSAVAFALTGSDNTEIQIIDRADCIFSVDDRTFYLNNVDADRISITKWARKTAFEQQEYFTVELHGEPTVYVYDKTTTNEEIIKSFSDTAGGREVLKAMKVQSPDYFEPKHVHNVSNETTLILPTKEGDRLTRAWRYIYANGCTGKKSPF